MVKRKASMLVFGFLFTAAALPRSASADLINVTSGFMEVTSPSIGRAELFGERDFSLVAGLDVALSNFRPIAQCNGSFACGPGAEVNLEAVFVGTALRNGIITFEGQTYDDAVGSTNSLTQANLELSGSVTAPPADSSATLTTPFSFTGIFTIPDETGTFSIRHLLTGGGTATLDLGFEPNLNNWRVELARYEFSADAAPIPEPGTILLVGLGMVGVARRLTRARTH